MRRHALKLFASALLLGVTLPSGASDAADIQERTLRLSVAGNKGNPQVDGAEKFAELVDEKSGGLITIKIFPGGVLGPDLHNYSAMQGGTLDMNISNASYLAGNVKEFAVLDFPFLFSTVEEADAIVDGPVGRKLFDKLQERGLVGLAYTELGFRQLNNKERPIATAEDLEGLKMRVIPTPLYIDYMNAVGANAVPMPYTETYTALETGAIDGMTNTPLNMIDMKFYEVAEYVTIDNHMYNPQAILISKITWDKLSDDEKKLIQESATEAALYQRQVNRAAGAKALEQLKDEGMEVNELPPEEIAKLKDKAQPVIDKYTADVGPELVAELNAELEKIRAKN
jgi:tripartite ATP-independent transporter DctP family solute receptor